MILPLIHSQIIRLERLRQRKKSDNEEETREINARERFFARRGRKFVAIITRGELGGLPAIKVERRKENEDSGLDERGRRVSSDETGRYCFGTRVPIQLGKITVGRRSTCFFTLYFKTDRCPGV